MKAVGCSLHCLISCGVISVLLSCITGFNNYYIFSLIAVFPYGSQLSFLVLFLMASCLSFKKCFAYYWETKQMFINSYFVALRNKCHKTKCHITAYYYFLLFAKFIGWFFCSRLAWLGASGLGLPHTIVCQLTGMLFLGASAETCLILRWASPDFCIWQSQGSIEQQEKTSTHTQILFKTWLASHLLMSH